MEFMGIDRIVGSVGKVNLRTDYSSEVHAYVGSANLRPDMLERFMLAVPLGRMNGDSRLIDRS
jgi:hypothetical protein